MGSSFFIAMYFGSEIDDISRTGMLNFSSDK